MPDSARGYAVGLCQVSTAEEGNSRLGLESQHAFGHEAFPGLGNIAAAEQHDDPLLCIPSDRHAHLHEAVVI
jgi:hypothetical protein